MSQHDFERQLFNRIQFAKWQFNHDVGVENQLAETPQYGPSSKRQLFNLTQFGRFMFNYPRSLALEWYAEEPGTDLLLNSAQFGQSMLNSNLVLMKFQSILQTQRAISTSQIEYDPTDSQSVPNQARFNSQPLNFGTIKRCFENLIQTTRQVVTSTTPLDRHWMFMNALFNLPTQNRVTFNQTQLMDGLLYFESVIQTLRGTERVKVQNVNLQFRVYPPYQKVRQYHHADQKMLPIAVSEMLVSNSEDLFVIERPGRHGSKTVLYTDKHMAGYIYTQVTHPRTKLPLFFKHTLPKFGFEHESELKMQLKLVRSDGTTVPDSLYHVIVDDQSGTIQVWTNLRSNQDEVYFLEINPSPMQKHGVRHIVLLDSRIDAQSFVKPAGYCWQLDLGYESLYVPHGLSQDSPWPLLNFSNKRNVFVCRQKAVKIRDGLYKVKPILYVNAYCDFPIRSISSHGFALIDSNSPVVELVCEYEQFGDLVLPDMRGNDYQAWSVLVEGGEQLELL